MFRNSSLRFTRVLLLLTLAQAGSAGVKFPDYPVRPAAQYSATSTRSGVTIGVQPLDDVTDQKTYFKTEMTSKGVVPVFIVIENGSASDSFVFDRTNVGSAALSKTYSSIGGMSEVHQNIMKKELQSATLSPGKTVSGFLYIAVPPKGSREKMHLQIPMTKAGTNESHVLNLIF